MVMNITLADARPSLDIRDETSGVTHTRHFPLSIERFVLSYVDFLPAEKKKKTNEYG